MENKHKKALIYICGILLLVFVCVLVGLFMVRRIISYSGVMHSSVESELLIQRDENGIPMVKAASLQDAYFAIGYLHAKDRLVLIEYFRAIAKGRLSELIGRDGLMLDKLSRVMGFSHRSAEIIQKLSPPYLEYIKFYTDGINSLKQKRYREFIRTIKVPGEEWVPEDVVAVLLMLEWSGSYLNNKELIFTFPEETKKFPLGDVMPANSIFYYDYAEQKNVFALKEIKKLLNDFLGPYFSGFAGYIGGDRSVDGKYKIFYNLDHSTNVYPAWYPVCLRINEKPVDGVTLSGMPFIFIGKNSAISFAGFPLKADTQDFFIETTRQSDNSEQYLSQGIWKDFEGRHEIIMAGKSGKKNETGIDIRMTDRGPVISDIFAGIYKTDIISIASVFPREDYIESLLNVATADSLDNARKAITNIVSIPKVYLFASRDKALEIFSGKIPVRNFPDKIFKNNFYGEGRGFFDLSGNMKFADKGSMLAGDSIYEWEPAILKNYIMFNDADRFSRLKELTTSKSTIDIYYIKSILSDIYSVGDNRDVQAFMTLLERTPVTSAKLTRVYFQDWDFKLSAKSVPSSILRIFIVKLIRETLADELKNGLDDIIDYYPYFEGKFIEAFVTEKSILFDDINTRDKNEVRDMIFDRAFLKAMRELNKLKGPIMEKWEWGSIHTGGYSIPLVKKDAFFSKSLYKLEEHVLEGGNSTINKGAYKISGNRFKVQEITALSGVYNEDLFVISPNYGYSINPFSEYYEPFNDKRNYNYFNPEGKLYSLRVLPKSK